MEMYNSKKFKDTIMSRPNNTQQYHNIENNNNPTQQYPMNMYILNDNIQFFWCLKIKIMKLIRINHLHTPLVSMHLMDFLSLLVAQPKTSPKLNYLMSTST
jgi:hypothetical protein